MRQFAIIFSFVFVTSIQSFGQQIIYPKYNIDSIYQILLKDTSNNSDVTKSWLKNYADSIKSYGNSINSFFPYKRFNSVVVFRQNEEYLTTGNKRTLSEQRAENKSYALDIKDINELLEIINNPAYFTFAECETAITQYEICFMNGSEIIETLKVACGDSQLTSNSKVKDMNWQRMKYGAITDKKARERLREILIHSGAYFLAIY